MLALSTPARRATPSFICHSCRQQLRRLWQPPTGKDQRSKYAAKVRDAEAQWAERAVKIRQGKKQSMLSILEDRGFVSAIAGDRKEFDQLLNDKRTGAYVGIDPTAPSMHLGNLLPLMALLWMFLEGFEAVTLLGGATVKIGDPTGRTKDREKVESTVRKANMVAMHVEIKKLWANMETYAIGRWKYKLGWAHKRGMVNNNDWMTKLSAVEFLRSLGSGMRMGPLLGRDTVKTKMEKGGGVSVAEFSYPLLQAWDWWALMKMRGVQVQIGGADQFGNIISGIDGVSYLAKNSKGTGIPEVISEMKPYGFTVPLLTTSKGEKFGKSAGNAVWLDQHMTSSFDLYQFFVRSADADVERYLKLFTLYPLSEIESIMAEHEEDRSMRFAQRSLAREVVSMLHGHANSQQAEHESGVLLVAPKQPKTPNIKTPYPDDINVGTNPNAPQVNSTNAPSHNVILPRSLVENQPIARVLYSAGLVSSRSEGHRLVKGDGVHIGSKPSQQGNMPDSLKYTRVLNWDPSETWKYVMGDSLMILRVGKWKVKIVKIIEDSEFKRRGLDAPGWEEFKTLGRSGPNVVQAEDHKESKQQAARRI